MRIRTITSHDVYNYGASLQAFSLMKYLQSLGHECKIIDYKPDYAKARYNFWYINTTSKIYKIIRFWPIRLVVCIILAPKRFKTIKRKKTFDYFTENYLELTKRFSNLDDLKKEKWNVDCFIVGSDQVWNTDHPNGRDYANYLSFVPEGKKKISFAASFGMDKIFPEYINMVKSELKKFDFISVRESTGVKLIENLGLKATHVVDPVFLNNKMFWHNIAAKSKINRQKYILVYDFGKNKLIEDFSIFLSKETGLPIISLNDFVEHQYASENINNAGPLDFLKLIENCSFFISNSYHGTAFSIIFHIPFFVFLRKKGNVNTRMEDLLKYLDLKERIVLSQFDFVKWQNKIDYNHIDVLLEKKVEESKILLKNNL